MFEIPKVTCIATPSTPDQAEGALRSFHRQRYGPKELILLTSFPDRVRDGGVLCLRAAENTPPGAVLNLATELATGQAVCHWSCTDFFHPFRLAKQVQQLMGNGVVASAFSRFLALKPGEIYCVDQQGEFLMPSLLFWKRAFYDLHGIIYSEYPADDSAPVRRLQERGLIASVNDSFYYVHAVTPEEDLPGRLVTGAELWRQRGFLTGALYQAGVPGPLQVKCLAGTVFEYNKCEEVDGPLKPSG